MGPPVWRPFFTARAEPLPYALNDRVASGERGRPDGGIGPYRTESVYGTYVMWANTNDPILLMQGGEKVCKARQRGPDEGSVYGTYVTERCKRDNEVKLNFLGCEKGR